MSKTIVQINYKFNMSIEEFFNMANHAAEPIAASEGLAWKVWLLNEADHEAGGIYLFESRPAAERFLEGPIPAVLATNPHITDIKIKLFGTIQELNPITRGPVEIAALS